MSRFNRKVFYFFKDLCVQAGFRIHLLLLDPILRILYPVTAFIFIFVLSSLNLQAFEKSSIPVGIVDEDQTGYSKELILGLHDLSSLFVYEGNLKEMESLLLDGYIHSIFVVKQDYEEKVKRGDTKELVTVYSGKEDKMAAILSDMIAGQMLEKICYHKGEKVYDSLGRSTKEYADYAKKNGEKGETTFVFDTKYILLDQNRSQQEAVDNALLYQQMIAGMIGLLLSFVLLFSFAPLQMEREQGLTSRKKLSSCTAFSQMAGNYLAGLVPTTFLCLLVSLVFVIGNQKISFSKIGSFFCLFFFFAAAMGVLFFGLGKFTKSVLQYQIIGAVILLLLGIIGFISIFEGLLPEGFSWIMKTPNAWMIKEFVGK